MGHLPGRQRSVVGGNGSPWHDFAVDASTGAWRILLGRWRGTESSSWPFCDGDFNHPPRFAVLTLPQLDSGSMFGLRMLDLGVAHYDLQKAGDAYTVTGLIENQAGTAQVLVQAEDVPAEGKPSQVESPVAAHSRSRGSFPSEAAHRAAGPAGTAAAGAGRPDPEPLVSSGLETRRFPPLLLAYLDRNYYTRETAVRAIFSVHVAEISQPLVAQCEIRPAGATQFRSAARSRIPSGPCLPSRWPVCRRASIPSPCGCLTQPAGSSPSRRPSRARSRPPRH